MSDKPRQTDARQTLITWLAVTGLTLLVASWGLAIYLLVPDNPPAWEYGVLPDVPGSSIYSTAAAPPPPTTGRQIALPPETLPARTKGPAAPQAPAPAQTQPQGPRTEGRP